MASNIMQYDIYHKEIHDFLRTVTIKFNPLKVILLESINTYVDPTIDDEELYYKRLMGEYIVGDIPMYVNSIDTGEKILFSKENLASHPKTASIYKIPNIEYDLLCKKYPNQIDLIKSIVYPVEDINLLRTNDLLAYINGDTSLLQSNETYSIINGIKEFFTICTNRWWVKEYCFEEGYPIAFYAMIWQLLPLICHTTRMTNIKTSSAHNYHIWEYLCSKGMEDYRDILTLKQSLFLYRNIDYILAHKGTMGNLFVLADNILSDFNIALVGKYIYQQQVDREDVCRRTPEIISKRIISSLKTQSPNLATFESIETINSRMYAKGISVKNTNEYVDQLEKELGEVEEDRLPTKLLELKKEPMQNSYEALLIEFIFDTLAYKLSNNLLAYECEISDPVANVTFKAPVHDAFALLYYMSEKSLGSDPITIPNHAFVRIPYKIKRPDINEIPTHMNIWDNNFPIKSFVDIETVLNEIPWQNDIVISPDDMQYKIFDQFSVMVKHIRDVRGSCDLCYTRGMWTVYNKCIECADIPITLSTYKTYNSFFASSDVYTTIFESYKTMNSKEYYDNFAKILFNAICPITDPRFKQYVGILDSMNGLFDKLTSLCIQLFSYNVTLLGTDRQKNEYLYFTPLAYHTKDIWGTSSITFGEEYLLQYLGRDQTQVPDFQDFPMLYKKQYDITSSPETMPAVSLSMSFQEYGVTQDTSRTRSSITYTFS